MFGNVTFTMHTLPPFTRAGQGFATIAHAETPAYVLFIIYFEIINV